MATEVEVVARITADTTGMTGGIAKAQYSLQQFGKHLTSTGKTLTTAVTLPIVALGAAAMVAFDKVDEGMDTVAARSGATGKALVGLQDVFKNVAAGATQDMATVGEVVGQLAGRFDITGAALEEMSSGVLTFARVTGTNAETAMSTLSKALTAFSLGTEDATEVMDILTAASQQSGVGVDTLAQQLAVAGPAFQTFGFDINQTTGVLAAFGKAGIPATRMVSGMNTAFKKMQAAGVTDMNKGLTDLFTTIRDSKSSTEATALAVEYFGSRVGVTLAQSIRSGKISLDELVAGVQGAEGALGTAAKAVEGPQEAFARLKNQAMLLGYEFIQTIEPAIQAVIGVAQRFVDALRGMDDGTKKMVIGLLAVAAAVGPILLIVGKLITSFFSLKAAIVPMFGWFSTLGGAAGGLGGALTVLTGPIGLTVAAIAGLIAIAVAMWKTSEKFREGVSKAFNAVKDAISGAVSSIQGKLEENADSINFLKDAFKAVADFIGTYIIPLYGQYLAGVIKAVTFVVGILIDYWSRMIGAFRAAIPAALAFIAVVTRGFATMADVVLLTLEGVMRALADTFGWIPGGVGDALNQAADAITGFRETTATTLEGFAQSTDNAAAAVLGMGGAASDVGGGDLPTLADGTVGAYDAIEVLGEEAARTAGMVDGLSTSVDGLIGSIDEMRRTDAWKTTLANLRKSAKEFEGGLNDGTQAARDFRDGVLDAFTQAANDAKALGGTAEDQQVRMITSFKDIVKGLRESGIKPGDIKTFLGDLDLTPTEVKKIMGQIPVKAKGTARAGGEEVGGAVASGAAAGIRSGTTAVTTAAEAMARAAYNKAMAALDASSPSREFIKVGTYVADGFRIGIRSGIPQVEKTVAQMAAIVKALAQKVSEEAADKLTAALDKFKSRVAEIQDVLKDRLGAISDIRKDWSSWVRDLIASTPTIVQSLTAADATFAKIGKTISGTKKVTDGTIASVQRMADAMMNQLGNALDAAQSQLEAAQDKFNDFKNTIRDAITGIMSFSDAQQIGEATGGGFIEGLRVQAEKAKAFAEVVRQLIAAGLSPAALQQVIAAGADAGTAIGSELLAGGSAAITEANTLVSDITAVADEVGQYGAAAFYQAGVDAAQAQVDAITQKIEALTPKLMRMMDRLSAKLQRQAVIDIKLATKKLTVTIEVNGGDVPAMARGGIVTRPTMALIGEAGPEAVIPLSQGSRYGVGAAGGGGMTIENLNVYAAPGERAEDTVPKALRRLAFVAGFNG